MVAGRPLYTLADYAAIESGSEARFEFVEGMIVAMAGGTVEHGRVCANVVAELRRSVRNSGCMALGSDVRIGDEASDFRAYPDATVVCGEPTYAEHPSHTVTNPVCVVEVLSESTAAYDTGPKLDSYKRIASLQTIVFVSQSSRSVIVHSRANGGFRTQQFESGHTLDLPRVGPVAVDDLYD